MITDAYCHCGVSKYEPVEKVLAVMEMAGVGRAMLCQHLGEYDNSYLARVVADHPGRFSATCLVDPDMDDALAMLEKWRLTGYVRGLRVPASSLTGNFELCQAAMAEGMNLVIYAPDGIAATVRPIQKLARSGATGHIVISHLGNPTVDADRATGGLELLDLAEENAVKVQLSGLSMFCPYPHKPLQAFIRNVVLSYGAERILWGSNFPVEGGVDAYRRALAFVRSPELELSEIQIEQILNRTAHQIWFE